MVDRLRAASDFLDDPDVLANHDLLIRGTRIQSASF